MSYQNQRSHNGMMGPQVRRGVHRNVQGGFPPVHPSVLHEEIQRLRSLLEMERAQRFEDHQRLAQLEAELEETKHQLKRQKALKEVFINKGKETKRELEMMEKLSDPAVANAAILASKVHNDTRFKNKKQLQVDFVELKTAHLLSQEAFTSEIQAEKDKNKTLQEELDKLQSSHEELCSTYESNKNSLQAEYDQVKRSYEELNQKYEQDLSSLKAQVETFEKQLELERETNSDRATKDREQIDKLIEEQDFIYESMTKEFNFLQISENNLQAELDQVKHSYEELDQKYKTDVSALKAQVEIFEKELEHERKASSDRATKDLEQIDQLIEEQDFKYESMTEEFNFLQSSENNLQAELDQVKHSYAELNETDVSSITAKGETFEKELEHEKEASQKYETDVFQEKEEESQPDHVEVRLASSEDFSEEIIDVAGGTIPENFNSMQDGKSKKTKLSVWKRIRNFMRLKKSKKGRKE